MVAGFDSTALKQFALTFSPYETHIRTFPLSADPRGKLGYNEKFQKAASVDEMMKRAKSSPKYHIWLGAYNVIVSIVDMRSEEHTSELQSLMRISYAVFCLKKKISKEHQKVHNM